MSAISEVRPSPIAGTWYSANPQQLKQQMNTFISLAEKIEIPGRIFGLLAPHAGHRYSGPTAGYAYRSVHGNTYELVVIISPAHAYYPASIISSAHNFYATPLGDISLHHQALDEFERNLENTSLDFTRVSNDEEHSIEIQLPFLQCTLKGDFLLLPLMMRAQDSSAVKAVAGSLTPILKKYNSLVIASSDLSHFYPQDIANELDGHLLQMVTDFSPEGVLKAEAEGSGFACGAGPIAVLLTTAKQAGADQVKLLHYSTSADVTGDSSSVVGYGSAVIYFSK